MFDCKCFFGVIETCAYERRLRRTKAWHATGKSTNFRLLCYRKGSLTPKCPITLPNISFTLPMDQFSCLQLAWRWPQLRTRCESADKGRKSLILTKGIEVIEKTELPITGSLSKFLAQLQIVQSISVTVWLSGVHFS